MSVFIICSLANGNAVDLLQKPNSESIAMQWGSWFRESTCDANVLQTVPGQRLLWLSVRKGQTALEDATAGDERLLKGKSLLHLGWGGVSRKGFLWLREENCILWGIQIQRWVFCYKGL